MTPRKRNKENRPLPKGWRVRYNAYYYQVPKGSRHHWDGKTEFRLGKTLAEAHQTFAERIGFEGAVNTMEQLCDRYTLEVVPKKALATQKSNLRSLSRIRPVFAANRVAAIEPVHIYQYQDHIEKTKGAKYAALDHEVLSHMFTCAIRWGLIRAHPMTDKKVVKPSTGKGRTVLPTTDGIAALLSVMPRKWQLYVALKIWTGRRKGELLRVTLSDLTDEGIRFTDNKRGHQFTLAWEPEIRAIVDELLRMGKVRGMHLFSNREGQPYINADGECSGFDSMWQRYKTKAGIDFTEHDLRKVRASQLSADQARELLQHTNQKQTERYRPSKVVRI